MLISKASIPLYLKIGYLRIKKVVPVPDLESQPLERFCPQLDQFFYLRNNPNFPEKKINHITKYILEKYSICLHAG